MPTAIEDLLHPFLGKYLGAPEWLKSSAGRAYRRLPQGVRLGAGYERFREELEGNASPGPTRSLESTLAWALETVPAYTAYRALARGGRDPPEVLAQPSATRQNGLQ